MNPRRDLSSALGPAAASRVDAETVKARGWRDNGILVVAENDVRLSAAEQAEIRRLGRKLYGERS